MKKKPKWIRDAAEEIAISFSVVDIEKIQEIILKHIPKYKSKESEYPGFDKFWKEYPTHKRKVNRSGCLSCWVSRGLEEKTDEIIKGLVAWKMDREWLDGFVPLPLVFLHQERWASIEAAEPPPGSLMPWDAPVSPLSKQELDIIFGDSNDSSPV